MAQAIKSLYPEAKFFVGPVIEDGFYYDFRVESKIGEEDLVKIEKKMKELAEAKIEISKYEITKSEALAKFQNDDLKQEVLLRIPDRAVSIYKQGEFEDLCRGPHVPNTKFYAFLNSLVLQERIWVAMKKEKCLLEFMELLLQIRKV